VPGVLLAIRKVTSEPRFYRGLDELLGLGADRQPLSPGSN
jgi:hypothetical protein